MADKKIKDGMVSAMTSRQKMTAVALVVVLLIVLWQVVGLMGSGSTSAPSTPAITPAKPAAQMSANAPGAGAGQAPASAPARNPNAPMGNPATADNQMAMPEQQPQLRETPATMDMRIMELQKQSEQKYIDQINQLQSLKIQREIAETNQAIANAKLATVTAEKNVSDLLTKPTVVQQQVPVGAYSSTLVNPTQTGVSVVEPPKPVGAEPPQSSAAPEIQYVVISVAMQLGKWSAVLGYQGKLYNVSIGDILPVDGTTVESIDKNGVVLVNKEGKKKKLSIISSV